MSDPKERGAALPRRNLFSVVCACMLCAVPMLRPKMLRAETANPSQARVAGQPQDAAIEQTFRGTPAMEIAGLSKGIGASLPDSAAVQAAFDHARTISQPWLFNHVVRCWLFGTKLAEARKLRPDPELLAISVLLHDIGLTPEYKGEVRFEVFGANAARAFAAGHGIDGNGQRLVWDSVALHATPSVARYKEVEVACCNAGITLDIGGIGAGELGSAAVEEIVGLAPRLAMKRQFGAAMAQIARDYPAVTYDNFIRDFGDRLVENYKAPSSVDFFMGAPFKE